MGLSRDFWSSIVIANVWFTAGSLSGGLLWLGLATVFLVREAIHDRS